MGNYTAVGRLTWQASARDKVRFYVDRQFNGEFYNGFNTLADDLAGSVDRRVRTRLGAADQVDADHHEQAAARSRHLVLQPAVRAELPRRRSGRAILPRLEQTTDRLTVAAGNTIPPYTSWTKSYSSMAAASYITGSHALKTGMTMQWGTNSRTFSSNAQINTLVFNAGLAQLPRQRHEPAAVHQFALSDRRRREQRAGDRAAEGEAATSASSSRTRGRSTG